MTGGQELYRQQHEHYIDSPDDIYGHTLGNFKFTVIQASFGLLPMNEI